MNFLWEVYDRLFTVKNKWGHYLYITLVFVSVPYEFYIMAGYIVHYENWDTWKILSALLLPPLITAIVLRMILDWVFGAYRAPKEPVKKGKKTKRKKRKKKRTIIEEYEYDARPKKKTTRKRTEIK